VDDEQRYFFGLKEAWIGVNKELPVWEKKRLALFFSSP
jgi:hypothetical protein